MVDGAIQDRIAKLLAKAKGTTNEHEAAIFAAKAAEMLAAHNLTEAMVAARQAGKDDPIGEHRYAGRVPDLWRQQILEYTALLYFCRIIWTRLGSKVDQRSYRMVGREHNAKVALAMGEYLIATVKRLAREHSPIRKEQMDFRKGCSDGLVRRLYRLWQEKAAPVSAANPGNLPALYDGEKQAIAEYLGDIHTAKRRSHSYGADGLAGYSAADRIGLHTQVAAETRTSRMIGRM